MPISSAPDRQPGRAEAEARPHRSPLIEAFEGGGRRRMAEPRRLATTRARTSTPDLGRCSPSRPPQDDAVERAVADILADVQRRGDAAVLEYTARFDRVDGRVRSRELEVPRAERRRARSRTPGRGASATRSSTAAARIRAYHERQRAKSWSYARGRRHGARPAA